MLVQIYEVTSSQEAKAIAQLGVDHVGVLVGEGEFPREQSIETAKHIFAGLPAKSKGSALSLSADLNVIERIAGALSPVTLHLGASTDLLTPEHVSRLKKRLERLVFYEAFRS